MTTPTPVRLPIPNGRQLTVRLAQDGQVANVVLGGIALNGDITAAQATAWLQKFWTAFRGVVTNRVNCTGATLRDVSVVPGPQVDVGPPTSPVGGDSGPPTLAAGCILINWRTTAFGRSSRGRTFIPGLTAGSVGADGRTYVAAVGPLMANAVNSYLGITGPSADGIQPAVLSFTKGAAYEINQGALAPLVGVQRRRMRG